MKDRIREIFDLKWIQEYVEKNIDQVEWIEEECGEKRRILVIDTLFSGTHGSHIPEMVLDLFGQAEGYDLEEEIYDALMFLETEVNDCLNKLLPSKGTYYIGYHEADGSYCLFYEEEQV